MKVLVIGGTGWVGHHIALACFRAGFSVVTMSRNPAGRFFDDVAFLPHIVGDKSNKQTMEQVLRDGHYDVVIDSVPTPNCIAILSELRQLYDRYIQCGSTGVYTPLLTMPADETHPIGRRVYDGFAGKIAADQAMLEANAAGRLRGTVLRPCCIAGPGKMPLDNLGGRRDDFIADIRNGKALDVLDGGTALLQIVHVRDLGRAFALAVATPSSVNNAYNICGDCALTVRRYCEVNAEALGVEAQFASMTFDAMIAKYGEDIRGGLTFLAEHMCLSNKKATAELGWRPEYSVEAAIRETAIEASQKLSAS